MKGRIMTLGTFLSPVIFSVLILSCTGCAAGYSQTLHVMADLEDGSRIVGKPTIESISLKAPYSEMTISLGYVDRIEFESGGEKAKVYFRNGDVIQGIVKLGSITMETLFGKQAISTRLITRLSVRREIMDDELILHYALDSSDRGEIRDLSKERNNGTWKGSCRETAFATPEPMEFNGIDNFIACGSVADPSKDSGIAILAWIKPSAWGDRQSRGIVSKKTNDDSMGYVLYNDGYYPTSMNFRFRGTERAANMLHSTANVDIGAWQHWAVTYNPIAREVRIYKNGILDISYDSIYVGDMNNNAPLYVGRSQTWNGYFSGAMRDVMIFHRALSADEIRSIYTSQQ